MFCALDTTSLNDLSLARQMSAICPGGPSDNTTQPLFTVSDVKKMTSFFSLTFAQNVRAFQYVCCELRDEVEEHRLVPVQTPLWPAPLSEAVKEEKLVEDSSATAIEVDGDAH
jgi:hypothetical protein